MIHVQHLLGVGHLQRAFSLAEAMAALDFEVIVVSGGKPTSINPPENVQLFQLAPLVSLDGHFDKLVDEQGQPIDDNWCETRCNQLLDLFHRFKPQILITETVPFGRRMLRFELLPLLEAAREYPGCRLIVSSIRDVLQPKNKPGREDEAIELIDRHYDRVLVHGDNRVSTLADSFGQANRIEEKTCYSGYIARSGFAQPEARTDEVLVSAGGSDRGFEILCCAIAARPHSSLADCPWRILVSNVIDDTGFARLQNLATEGIVVERNRRDFPELLARARLSISQAGYNTMTDLLATSTPAVVVPYAEAEELEQSLRADRLQQLGRVILLAERDLSAETMAEAIDRANRLEINLEVDLKGAQHSAELISGWYQACAH